MAGSIPDKDKGIIATIDAHVKGQTIDSIGGYFTSMTIGDGGTISPTLKSVVKGQTAAIQCAAFFTHLYIESDAVLYVKLLVDTITVGGTNAAGALSALIKRPQPRIAFTGTVGAYQTTDEAGGRDVLKPVNIQGQIWREKDGKLKFSSGREVTFGGSHLLQEFSLGILPDKSTDLQLNFGGQVNSVWTVGPLTAA